MHAVLAQIMEGCGLFSSGARQAYATDTLVAPKQNRPPSLLGWDTKDVWKPPLELPPCPSILHEEGKTCDKSLSGVLAFPGSLVYNDIIVMCSCKGSGIRHVLKN
jgi:hypothetical protein